MPLLSRNSLGPQDTRARLLLVQLVGGLDAVAALEVGQRLARVGRGRPDDLVVLDLVLGDLPRGRKDGEEGDGAEGQADRHRRAEGEPPACVGEWPRQLWSGLFFSLSLFFSLTPSAVGGGGRSEGRGPIGDTYRFCFCLCSVLGGSWPYGPPRSSFFLSSGGIGE